MSSPESPGYVSNYVARAVKEGMRSTAALRAFRGAGGHVRTQTWYRVFGEVTASIARAGAVARAPLGRRPLASERSTWSTIRQTGYVYQVEAQIQPIGTGEVITTYTSFKTSRLVPYGEALAGALEPFESELAEYGETVLGGVVTGVYELVPGQ